MSRAHELPYEFPAFGLDEVHAMGGDAGMKVTMAPVARMTFKGAAADA